MLQESAVCVLQCPAVAGLLHGQKILGEDRLLLARRGGMAVADAGKDGCDVPVAPIKVKTALGVGPGQRRQSPFDGRDRVLAPADRLRAGSASGDIETDDLWIGPSCIQSLAPAPSRKVLPVGGIGLASVCRTRRLGIEACPLG